MIKLSAAALMVAMTSAALAQPASPGLTNQKPIDNGPTSPGANNAYQGGGVVLQGAPGAGAPIPQATPQGQKPTGAVDVVPSASPSTPPTKAADD
jgi:hypothetical protein